MKVKVLNIHLLHSVPESPLKGFATVEVDGWIMRDFRIIVPNGEGGIFVDSPQIFLKDKETGRLKPKPILTIPKEARKIVVAAILEAYWEKARKDHGKSQTSRG